MAIDPQIALGVRPVQIPVPEIQTPLERFAKVLSLRNLMTQTESGKIGLQSQQLQFEQLQRDMQERQDLANWLHLKLTQPAPGAAVAPAPAPGTPPSIPPVQPTPVGGTVAQTAPAMAAPFQPTPAPAPGTTTIAPDFGLPARPAAGTTIGDVMTGGAVPPTPAATAPAAAMPAIGGQDISPFSRLDLGELVTVSPIHGTALAKNILEFQKTQLDNEIKQHDANAKTADELGRAANAIRKSKSPATQFVTELTQLGNKGTLPWPTVRQMISDGYDAHKNDIDAFIDKAQSVKDDSEIARNNLQADLDDQKKAAIDIRSVFNQDDYTNFLALRRPNVRAQFPATFSRQIKAVIQGLETPQAQLPKAQLEQIQTDAVRLAGAMKQGPEAAKAVFDSLDPNSQKVFAGATTWQDIVQRGLTAEQTTTAAQAAATAAETAKQHGLQNVFEAMRVKIEGQKNAREERVYDLTYGEGANQALVGVAPNLRVQVSREAHKIGDEYRKAQAVADQMQSLIELTRAGNKAAGTNLPLVGVETVNAINGIKRINKDEIKQYGSAGSLLDKIQGRLSGLTVGQPIPADVLTDIETMHNTLRQNSETEYRTRLEGLNRDYKSDFQPDKPSARGVAPEVNSALQSGQSIQEALKNAAPGTYTASDGTKWLKKPGESAKQIK
jgi:hypothetical protein